MYMFSILRDARLEPAKGARMGKLSQFLTIVVDFYFNKYLSSCAWLWLACHQYLAEAKAKGKSKS